MNNQERIRQAQASLPTGAESKVENGFFWTRRTNTAQWEKQFAVEDQPINPPAGGPVPPVPPRNPPAGG